MTCRLCLRDRELRNSHILPEFLFRKTYNEESRARELTVDIKRIRWVQQGYREYLLCAECEQRIGRYETYFANTWYGSPGRPKAAKRDVVTVSGLDYARFKLFHLSILWRAGITSLTEFANIRLGPHAERMRVMIYNDDAGTPNQYPFWGLVLILPETRSICDDVIIEPEMSRVKGHTVYVFTFGGCSWFYFASSHLPGSLVPVRFDMAGVLTLGVQNIFEYQPLVESWRRFHGRP